MPERRSRSRITRRFAVFGPAAIVVVKPGCELSTPELTAFLEKKVAKFKLPRVVRFDAEPLPKTGTGKILKRELREMGPTQNRDR